MKRKNASKCFISLLSFMMFFSVVVIAQERGTIVGKVTDEATGNHLPGANVLLEGTRYGAATDRYGDYLIQNVPFGSYTLVIRYIGYDTYTTIISVAERRETVNVQLEQTAIELEGIVVSGLREGQTRALNIQKTSKEIKNVLSREEMEKFPDLNTAEALQRIPGVAISRDLGEGAFVHIRGTEPRFTGITVDGQRVPTTGGIIDRGVDLATVGAGGGDRTTNLGIVNANQLASIEVSKALTPDMDADGIGGRVNIVTRSAFDYDIPQLRLDIGGGYADLSREPQYRISGSYVGFAGNEREFGYTISGNFYQNIIQGQAIHNDYGNIRTVGRVDIPFTLTSTHFLDYISQRKNFGFSSALEYRLDANNRFHLRGIYDLSQIDLTVNNIYYRMGDGRWMDENTVTRSRVDFTFVNYVTDYLLMSIAAGGEHRLGNVGLEYNLHYGRGKQDYSDPPRLRSEWQLRDRVNFLIDKSNPRYPQFEVLGKEPYFFEDPTLWRTDAQEFRWMKVTDDNYSATINVNYPYNIFGVTGELKGGFKFTHVKKNRDALVTRYFWKGEGLIQLDSIFTDDILTDFLYGRYRFGIRGNIRTTAEARDFMLRHIGDGLLMEENFSESEGLGGNYTNYENIYASYAMTTFNIGNLMILGGIRAEILSNNYQGIDIFEDVRGNFSHAEESEHKTDYYNILPYLHLRYSLTAATNIRFAFTQSLARPNFFDLIPYQWVDHGGHNLDRGNSELEPTISTNLDFMFEHYFQGIGIISAGVFYKDIDGVIYNRTFKQIGGVYDGWSISEPVNAGRAYLYGYEVNWMQQFTFLPGLLNGLGIYANYSKNWAEADLEFRDWTVLPGQAGDVGNMGISYEKHGLTLRFSANYSSPVLISVGTTPDHDHYRDEQLRFDFSGIYEISDALSFYVDLRNINNEPYGRYHGQDRRSRPIRTEFTGTVMSGGIRINL